MIETLVGMFYPCNLATHYSQVALEKPVLCRYLPKVSISHSDIYLNVIVYFFCSINQNFLSNNTGNEMPIAFYCLLDFPII